jgi:hypothetical protein
VFLSLFLYHIQLLLGVYSFFERDFKTYAGLGGYDVEVNHRTNETATQIRQTDPVFNEDEKDDNDELDNEQ